MRSYAEEVERLAATAIKGLPVETRRRSLVPWAPNIPGEHAWAVVGRDGLPEVKAHDVFEAALWFARLEAGDVLKALPPGGVVLPPDERLSAAEDAFRRGIWSDSTLSLVIDKRRETAQEAAE